MQNNTYRELLNFKLFRNWFHLYFHKKLDKDFEDIKNVKYWGLKETGTSYEQRFDLRDNQWQNLLPKVRKSSKIGQDQKVLIFVFAYVLTTFTKTYFLKWKVGVSNLLWDFFFNFLISYNLKSYVVRQLVR